METETLISGLIAGVISGLFTGVLFPTVKHFFTQKIDSQNKKKAKEIEIDTALFTNFKELLPSSSDSIVMLKEHNWGSNYCDNRMKGIQQFIDDWSRPEKSFLNPEIEETKSEFYTKIKEFDVLLQHCSGVFAPERNIMTTKLTGEYPTAEQLAKRENEIYKLNEISRESYRLYRHFLSETRKTLAC